MIVSSRAPPPEVPHRCLQLQLLTSPHDRPASTAAWLAYVHSAVRGGVSLVQLRNKHDTAAEILAQAQRLRRALAADIPLILNDRPELVHEAGAQGVHLGQKDTPPTAARQILGADAIIGWSVEHPDQLKGPGARAQCAASDYLGAGPVFAAASKADAAPLLGLSGLAEIVRLAAPLPVVAIGGVAAGNAAAVWRSGVAGVAAIASLAEAASPRAAAHAILAARRCIPQESAHKRGEKSPR